MAKFKLQYKTLITLGFLALAVVQQGFMMLYFVVVLEPKNMENSRIIANKMLEPFAATLGKVLTPSGQDFLIDGRAIRRASFILDKMMLLTDENGIRFFGSVTLQIDRDVLGAEDDLVLMKERMKYRNSFPTEAYVLAEQEEFIGLLQVQNNPESYWFLKKDVRRKIYIGSGAGILILAIIWRIVLNLQKKLEKRRRQLMERGRFADLGTMAATMSHDIAQPLTAMRLDADLLEEYFDEKEDCEEYAESARGISEQIVRIGAIVDAVKNLSKNAQPGLTDALKIVGDVVLFYESRLDKDDIVLSKSLPKDIPRIWVDPVNYWEIVLNLITNAMNSVNTKAGSASDAFEKRIEISLSHDATSDTVVLEIADNGVGMSAKVRENCMKPFYTTSLAEDSTGLGLSIVRDIVQKYNMRIDLESEEGKGAVFRISAQAEEKHGNQGKNSGSG